MGYLHINNLYKNQEILLFKECYALEKIHGTSAHISFTLEKGLKFFSGGENYPNFVALFNQEELISKFKEYGKDNITLFGEAYGGKQQGMKATYGDKLKFVVFDVQIGDYWCTVPLAEQITKMIGLEFVDYVKISTELTDIDKERDKDSVQAIRNGMGDGKKREGVVLRPLIELQHSNGGRVICKHKRIDFQETKTSREVVPLDQLKILEEANLIAEEWVTGMRLNHVLDKIPDLSIEKTGTVIKAMLDDILREGKGEIKWSKQASTAVSKKTASMFKEYLNNQLKEK